MLPEVRDNSGVFGSADANWLGLAAHARSATTRTEDGHGLDGRNAEFLMTNDE